MSLKHGINTYKSDTSFSTVQTAGVGIPFFVGAWPCHTAGGFAGKPQIANSFDEAKTIGGYSEEWRDSEGNPKWTLCQAMYSHFKLFAMAPAIFCNVFDPDKHKMAVASSEYDVTDHIVILPVDALNDTGFEIKSENVELIQGTDFEVYYSDNNFVVELLADGGYYNATTLSIGYNAANPAAITVEDVEAAIEEIEKCMSLFGMVPDLICCPGYSSVPTVAAVMAAKAASINGLFKGTAVVDIDTSSADDYSKVLSWKNNNGYTDENMIVCWPMVKIGEYLYDYSVILCGLMAQTDVGNDDVPYESPSNKSIPITGVCVKDGTEITLSVQQADVVSVNSGVVTVLNYGGWVTWGNYTGCFSESSDVAKHFICTKRMMDFLCNTFAKNYWTALDKPLTRVRIDAIVNSYNSYLNGLTHDGKLYGGEIAYVSDNNPTADLIAGKFRLDVRMASPVPAQEIDMYIEYDVDYLMAALNV